MGSTLEELKSALRDTLAARGSLGQIQARVRAEIFNALEETEDPKPPLSHENLIINELIREYLDYNHYKHTLAVLLPETGQPPERINRAFLAQELGVREDVHSRPIPLLYSIVSKLQNNKAASRRREEAADQGLTNVSPPKSISPNKQPTSGGSARHGTSAAFGGNRSPPYDSLQQGAARGYLGRDVRASRDPEPIVM